MKAILTNFQEIFNEEMHRKLGAYLGETNRKTTIATTMAVQMILERLPVGRFDMAHLFARFGRLPTPSAILCPEYSATLADTSRDALHGIFVNEDVAKVSQRLSIASGIARASARNLLTLLVPMAAYAFQQMAIRGPSQIQNGAHFQLEHNGDSNDRTNWIHSMPKGRHGFLTGLVRVLRNRHQSDCELN